MKKREKILVFGGSLVLAGYFIMTALIPLFAETNEANAKKQTLETQISATKGSITQLQTDIDFYKQKLAEPLEVNIQRYSYGKRGEAAKQLVSKLLDAMEATGAQLISLVPFSAQAPTVTVKEPTSEPGAEGKTPGEPTEPAEPAAAAPGNLENEVLEGDAGNLGLPVAADGFTFQARGSFQEIQSFLAAVKNNPEAVEIESVTLKNEAGPIREEVDAGTSVPTRVSLERPIRMEARVRLFLMEAN